MVFITILIALSLSTGCQRSRAETELRRLGYDNLRTQFFQVLNKGDVRTAELFIQAGQEPNGEVPEEGATLTPLHLAVRSGNPELVKLLLHHGAHPNARSRPNGLTPLMLVAMGGINPAVAEALLTATPSLAITDSHGDTALEIAIRQSQVYPSSGEVAELLSKITIAQSVDAAARSIPTQSKESFDEYKSTSIALAKLFASGEADTLGLVRKVVSFTYKGRPARFVLLSEEPHEGGEDDWYGFSNFCLVLAIEDRVCIPVPAIGLGVQSKYMRKEGDKLLVGHLHGQWHQQYTIGLSDRLEFKQESISVEGRRTPICSGVLRLQQCAPEPSTIDAHFGLQPLAATP